MSQTSSTDKNHWGVLVCGFLTLIASAFFDGMKGPLLPVIAKELALPYGRASWFLTGANVGALFASLFLSRVLARYGEKKTFLAICGFAMATSLVSLTVTTLGTLLVFGAMLGGLVSLFGTMCSILILQGGAARVRGNIFSGAQVLVALSFLIFPILLTSMLARGVAWNMLVAPAAAGFFLIALLAVKVLPAMGPAVGGPLVLPPVTRAHVILVAVFGVYVAGETMGFVWLITYARDVLGKSEREATAILVQFFIWFAASRFVAGLVVRPRWETRAIVLFLVAGTIAAVLGLAGYDYCLPAAGLVGPFFPLTLTHASRIFPLEWKRITVWVFLYIQLFMALTHLMVGYLSDRFGLATAYWLMPSFFLLALFIFIFFQRRFRL